MLNKSINTTPYSLLNDEKSGLIKATQTNKKENKKGKTERKEANKQNKKRQIHCQALKHSTIRWICETICRKPSSFPVPNLGFSLFPSNVSVCFRTEVHSLLFPIPFLSDSLDLFSLLFCSNQ